MHVVIIVHKNSQLKQNILNGYGDMEVLKSFLI